ncbi:hypothetical protein EYF80_037096 [Liparis tanakae]|uniref:Uncharacterized protein n=1 Tax=Liparis tanakae TaxID=230148 RepID=A0A4Z2GGV5_9TELE|nr:hypothetical protein EYF80_037096 [Liparis tanakae]
MPESSHRALMADRYRRKLDVSSRPLAILGDRVSIAIRLSPWLWLSGSPHGMCSFSRASTNTRIPGRGNRGSEVLSVLLVEVLAVDDPHLFEESRLAALARAEQQDLHQPLHAEKQLLEMQDPKTGVNWGSLDGGKQSYGLKLESYRFNLHDNPHSLRVGEREKSRR